MLRLKDLGTDGLRRLLEQQQREEMEALDQSYTDIKPGTVGEATRNGSAMSRKNNARARMLVDAQRHRHLIEAHICRMYSTPEIRAGILAHVSVLKNLQRQVTNAIAVAYSRPPSRVFKDVDETEARKFATAYREAGTDELAEQWNRQSFFLGVVHVLPRYEQDEQGGGRLTWVTVLPDCADVLFDPKGEKDPSVLVYETTGHGAVRVAVDSERWWWLNERWEVVREEEHNMNMRPWVVFRWEQPPSFDYWNRGQAQDIYEATLEMGRLLAHMRWVRKNYSKKTETLHLGQNVKAPPGQNMGAIEPIVTIGDGDHEFEVHDTAVPPDAFIVEMRELTEAVLEGHGLPANVVDFNTASTQDASNAFAPAKLNKHEALVKVRDKSVKMYKRAELELAVRAVAVLRAHGQSQLTEQQVRESLSILFASLSFADTPVARMASAKAQQSMMQTNPIALYQAENPGATTEEARAAVLENIRIIAELNAELVSYNMTIDADKGLMTTAQINGMIGGELSAAESGEEPS